MTKCGRTRQITPEGSPKHKLECKWSFWYDAKNAQRGKVSWQRNMENLGSFDTVEDFWCHYVHMRKPSTMPTDSNYYCFRNGLFPAWETFPGGGCWILKVKKSPGVLNTLWQNLLFALIGEIFEEPAVVGCMLAARGRFDVISVWNNNPIANTRFEIGEVLKSVLQVCSIDSLHFFLHSTFEMCFFSCIVVYHTVTMMFHNISCFFFSQIV
eukprot:GSMAST32.ASY1.ANO1.2321.1 assembled CDS